MSAMRRHRLVVVLATFAAILTSSPAAGAVVPPAAQAAPDQEGVSFTAWWRTLYDGTEPEQAMANIADTGAEWVSILATWYQPTYTSTNIAATRATPTDAGVVHMIRHAHTLGLEVMLKPHVDLFNDPAHWRGQIGTTWGRRSPKWDQWFQEYRRFIFHYAALAEREGVEQLSVGCELSGTVRRTQQWRGVIAGIRNRFSGTLVYASTAGAETTRIQWWDSLDLIGVDAYYELTDSNDPTVAELEAGWAPWLEDLAALSTRWGGKPIIFTEIGYRSIDGANQAPWDWQRTGTVDLQEQADCYEAALATVWDEPWFAGMFWWDWSAVPSIGGLTDDGYTPFDKPAEDVLRAWY